MAVLDVFHFRRQNFPRSRVRADKLGDRLLFDGHVAHETSRLRGLLAGVDKDEDLVLPRLVKELLVADFVHRLESLDSLLFSDIDDLLLKSTPTIGGIKVEESLGLVHAGEGSHVLVIGQCCRHPNEPNVVASLFHPPDSTWDNAL